MSSGRDRHERRIHGRWQVVVLAVASVASAVLAGCTSGSGGSTPPSPNHKHSHRSTPTSSTPSGPNACALASTAQVGSVLHEHIASAKSTTRAGAPFCTWANSAGKPLATLELSTQSQTMLLDTLANNGAYQPKGLGGYTVFAPRPPRLVHQAGSYAALVTLQPAWYERYLPKGKTNPSAIPHSTTVTALLALERIIIKNS